jgi:hypothetical protein
MFSSVSSEDGIELERVVSSGGSRESVVVDEKVNKARGQVSKKGRSGISLAKQKKHTETRTSYVNICRVGIVNMREHINSMWSTRRAENAMMVSSKSLDRSTRCSSNSYSRGAWRMRVRRVCPPPEE